MKKWILYCIWGCMYILCVGLGFLQDPPTASKIALVIISLLFFVPGAMLLWAGIRDNDRKEILRIRIISLSSLGLTLIVFIANLMSISAPKAVGDALSELLILVSAPMVCSQYWMLSLLLWACLLSASFTRNPSK